MNIKNVFSMVNDVLTGIGGVLMSLVSVSILSTVIFGAGWLGIDVITNISALVGSFLTGGVTGLLVLIILLTLWDNK
mgnify:CR=1 FL=1|jgi:hypothetical protein|tara:strand:+ start:729 stop:959 length:231 start_codon:yes stop_codon:yes gene_type:complete